jgi:serine/threonine-protein kinase
LIEVEAAAGQRALAPGTMLDEKYRVEKLLAVGGMGAVYVGTHTALRKRVAIKVLNPQLATPAMVQRFQREAITASQIGHEGIAQVTDLGTSKEGEAFLVMELLEGESLATRLKATGPLPIELACELAVAILSPLAAAHHAGIVHRDLKPDNVFLVRQSRGELVKLLDFGISRAAGLEAEFRLTNTGVVMGTPFYMSPEQARGDSDVTPGSDLYSIGVILYEMLVGTVPITGENYNQLMYRVLMGEYTPARERRPDIPEALDAIIRRAMATDVAERWASASELEQALLAFCRATYRDNMIERVSSAGIPWPTGRTTPFPLQTPVPTPPPPTTGTDPTMMAPAPVTVPPLAKKSKLPLIIGALLVAGGIAAAVVMTQKEPDKPKVAAIEPPLPIENKPLPPPPPPVPATVTIKFAVEPKTATILLDGKPVTDAITVEKDTAEHQLEITAPGFTAHSETLHFDDNQRVAVTLAKQATKPVVRKTTKHNSKIEVDSPYK